MKVPVAVSDIVWDVRRLYLPTALETNLEVPDAISQEGLERAFLNWAASAFGYRVQNCKVTRKERLFQ